jgi:hypothetical protein
MSVTQEPNESFVKCLEILRLVKFQSIRGETPNWRKSECLERRLYYYLVLNTYVLFEYIENGHKASATLYDPMNSVFQTAESPLYFLQPNNHIKETNVLLRARTVMYEPSTRADTDATFTTKLL